MSSHNTPNLPYDADAELILLGNCLFQESAEPLGGLAPHQFFSAAHRQIATAIHALAEKHQPIDTVQLARELTEAKAGVSPSEIASLTEGVPILTAASLTWYRDRVKELHQQRLTLTAAYELGQAATQGSSVTEIRECAADILAKTAPAAAHAVASKVVLGETSEHLTDSGNVRRLVKMHGRDLRYCSAFGKWLGWDGTRWKPDETGEIVRRTKEALKSIYTEADQASGKEEREALERWAKQSEAEGKIRAAISLAESEREIVIRPEQLDRDPWLLNCENGTLDLQTLKLRPPCREDYLTQKAGGPYDPLAKCPVWDDFLNVVTHGNADLQAFLQCAAGYALTGLTIEQCLFILWGTGQNGKTTLLEALRMIMGDYQYHAEFSTFLHLRSRTVRNDVAAMKGKRYVTAIEANPGDRLDESLIKTVTGGDPVTARFFYKEHFTYRPTYKLFLGVNDKPVIRGSSKGTWRRIRLVPFTVEIPDQKVEKQFLEKLRPEFAGILAWAVRGLEKWKGPGLKPPPEVVEATKEYREEMDIVGGFLSECCVRESEAETTARELYGRYKAYCEHGGERPLSQRDFGLALRQRGFNPVRRGENRRRAWEGLRLAGEGAG